MAEFKGAFSGCSWCGGKGCNQCSIERKKYEEATMQPIMTFKLGDAEDMDLAKNYIGAKAIEHAFGPDGRGMEEIYDNALAVNVIQVCREAKRKSETR